MARNPRDVAGGSGYEGSGSGGSGSDVAPQPAPAPAQPEQRIDKYAEQAGCPPGEVWHAWPAPGRCEAPDALSKADKDTCNEENHPDPKECYWCNFDTQQWVRGWCGE